jgi:hypothetical protein
MAALSLAQARVFTYVEWPVRTRGGAVRCVRTSVCIQVLACEEACVFTRAHMKIKTDDFGLGTSDSEDMKWLVCDRAIDNCLD